MHASRYFTFEASIVVVKAASFLFLIPLNSISTVVSGWSISSSKICNAYCGGRPYPPHSKRPGGTILICRVSFAINTSLKVGLVIATALWFPFSFDSRKSMPRSPRMQQAIASLKVQIVKKLAEAEFGSRPCFKPTGLMQPAHTNARAGSIGLYRVSDAVKSGSRRQPVLSLCMKAASSPANSTGPSLAITLFLQILKPSGVFTFWPEADFALCIMTAASRAAYFEIGLYTHASRIGSKSLLFLPQSDKAHFMISKTTSQNLGLVPSLLCTSNTTKSWFLNKACWVVRWDSSNVLSQPNGEEKK